MADSEGTQKVLRRKRKEANRHECLFCFRLFATAARLRRHSIIHSDEKKIFHCQFCGQSFRLHKELISHEATHKRTLADINLKRCKICGIACYNGNLLAHLKEHHEHFECDMCKKVYRTKNHLKLHMTTHINAREYKCSMCPKAFNFFSQLKRHERSHSSIMVWYCEICGLGFKNKPNLSHHMRSHNGEKPFQCDRCDRSFSAKQSLHLHIRIHNGEKPYKCPWEECGRCFNDLATMKVHTRVHTNENPYKCHICGKTTKQASNLKSHYLHAHKIKDITSKTIRSNARLIQKYKTENLPEAGLLDILSQQVMQHFEKEEIEGNTSTMKEETVTIQVNTQEKSAHSHVHNSDQLVEEPISSIVNMKPNVNLISNQIHTVNKSTYVQSLNGIKMESTFNFEDIPYDATTSSLIDVRESRVHIKEEKSDTSFENIHNVIEKSSSPKMQNIKTKSEHQMSRNQQIRKQLPQDIEKVFVDEQNYSMISTEMNVKDEIVMGAEHIDEFQIIEFDDVTSCTNTNTLHQANSELSVRDRQSNDKTIIRNLQNISSFSPTNNSSVRNTVQKFQKEGRQNKLFTLKNSFKCDICPESFTKKMKLKLHMKSHAFTTANDKLKICEICGKVYTQYSALKKHLKFTHSDFRPFPCTLCERAFKDSTGLKVHLRSHSGEKPYTCSFCPKSFSTTMGRNLHIRSHTGEKPYKCSFCESAFSDNSTYRQHVRVHTGEKPYVCHLCGKGTTQAGNLKSHLRHAHKIQMKNVSMKRN